MVSVTSSVLLVILLTSLLTAAAPRPHSDSSSPREPWNEPNHRPHLLSGVIERSLHYLSDAVESIASVPVHIASDIGHVVTQVGEGVLNTVGAVVDGVGDFVGGIFNGPKL